MNSIRKSQHGFSAIGLIITLAIIGAGTYIGLQYIPQYLECSAADSILSTIEKAHKAKPVSGVNDIRNRIDRQLDMNQMNDLRDSFTVKQDGNTYIVKVSYERELNLIYTKKAMQHEKTLTLK